MKKLCLGATTDDLGDSRADESCAIVQDAKTTSNCVFGGVGAVGQHNLSQKCDDAVLPPMQDGSSLSITPPGLRLRSSAQKITVEKLSRGGSGILNE